MGHKQKSETEGKKPVAKTRIDRDRRSRYLRHCRKVEKKQRQLRRRLAKAGVVYSSQSTTSLGRVYKRVLRKLRCQIRKTEGRADPVVAGGGQ